jgi:hypothetical protein
MRAFSVTVRTDGQHYRYTAIAATSIDAHADALDAFGPCCIVVTPA